MEESTKMIVGVADKHMMEAGMVGRMEEVIISSTRFIKLHERGRSELSKWVEEKRRMQQPDAWDPVPVF